MDQHHSANFINEFFTNIGKNLASKIKNEDWQYLDMQSENEINVLQTDFEEVLDICVKK